MSIGASPSLANYPQGFANGVALRGVPVAMSHPGKAYWVYNGTAVIPGGRGGSDNNRGTFESPFASINGALDSCVAGRGDVIFVKPGHAETLSSATAMALDIAGVAVIGLGAGNARPTFTLATATTATIAVSAANVTISNCIIDATGVDAVAAALTVTAAGFGLFGCLVRLASASAQAVLGVSSSAAADYMSIEENQFLGTSDAGTTCALNVVGGTGMVVKGNVFYGAYSAGVGAIQNITTACTNALVKGNHINNLTAASTKAMVFVAGSTGQISGNCMQILSGTAPITGAAMSWVGANYYAATIATAGSLI